MVMATVKIAIAPLIVDTESYSRLFLNHPILWTVFGIFFLGFGIFMGLHYNQDKKHEKEMGQKNKFEQHKEQLKEQMRSTSKVSSSGATSKKSDSRHVDKDQVPEQMATGSIWTTMLNQIESNQDKQNDSSSSHKHHHDSSSPSSHHSTSHHDSSSSSGNHSDSGSSSSSSDSSSGGGSD